MPIYGPFYAGKNAPGKNKTRKAVTKKATPKRSPVLSKKSSCANAAKRLVKCRKVKNTMKCKKAGKNLITCRWK